MKHFVYILWVALAIPLNVVGQNTVSTQKEFDLQGTVKAKGSGIPVADAVVQISGYRTERTNTSGEFAIRARIGDELVVSHPSFETVFHTLRNEDRIEIRVEGLAEEESKEFSSVSIKRAKAKISIDHRHAQYIDSANFYKKRDIDKSIIFVENAIKALGKRADSEKASLSYTTLGDIYQYWGQYDLAINSYENAMRYRESPKLLSKLGGAQLANANHGDAITTFKKIIDDRSATAYHKVVAYEGLGDAYTKIGNEQQAIDSYQEGLQLAQQESITPKITDLNARLASAFEQQGEVQQAQDFYSNSLELAKKESPQRSLQQKERVADFYNRSNQYDQEIQLRKEALAEIESIEADDEVVASNERNANDSITSQKINYKIGTSYIAQQKLEEAIPYLENSIEQADKASDLVVKKDATRRLSEVYESKGDFTKALEAYQNYVTLVDQLYIQKEQQISQVSRFSRDIANKQNRISSLEKDRELSESKLSLYVAEQELTEESNRRQRSIIYGLLFGMLLLAAMVFFMYRSIKQQRLNNDLLALRSLRSQMNPHFIFNALNSVNNYIAVNDERNANRYLSEFSALMRSVLENSEQDFIPLTKEIELLRLYLKLEHARFKDKFDYEISVDEHLIAEDFVIPPMLLQPYVENAVWHGLRYKEEKGDLKVLFTQKNEQELHIIIEDDGIGRKRSKALKTANQQKQRSTGMSNIRKRIRILNEMYKGKVDVLVEDVAVSGEGTRVRVTLKKD